MKALLIGSAPCLLDQIKKVKLEEYSVVAVVNDWLNPSSQDLYTRYGVQPNYYFFSDWFYFNLGRSEDINKQTLKKIICVPGSNRLNSRRLPGKPVDLTVEDFLRGKGILEAPRVDAQFLGQIGGYGRRMWPSTGMLALGYLFLQEKVQGVDLAGFSFFEGKCHYYDEMDFDKKRHEVSSEVKIYEYFHRNYHCEVV
jgi:hypothetical protein